MFFHTKQMVYLLILEALDYKSWTPENYAENIICTILEARFDGPLHWWASLTSYDQGRKERSNLSGKSSTWMQRIQGHP